MTTDKVTSYFYLLIISSISFIISFFLFLLLKNTFFSLAFDEQLHILKLTDKMSVYLLIYLLWDVILFFSFFGILTVIFAKVLNIEISRIFIITISSLILSIIMWHTIMYYYFKNGDLIGLKNTPLLIYMLNYTSGLNSDFANNEPSDIVNVLYPFLVNNFIKNPSIINYFLVYYYGKLFVDPSVFERGTFNKIYMTYDILFIIFIYIAIFTLFYFLFAKSCNCITRKMINDKKKLKFEKEKIGLFGKKELETQTYNSGTNIEINKRVSKDIII